MSRGPFFFPFPFVSMPFAYEKLNGLDRDRLVEAIEPVLRAHGLAGVEAIWRTDHRGWVLYLTVERPDSTEPGAGITLDLCADVSRDLSAALDVLDVVPGAYRLEVGSPGVERKLYSNREYQRFAGQHAKVRSSEPVEGEVVHRGVLAGLDDDGHVLIDTERGVVALDYQKIVSGQLVLGPEWAGISSQGPRAGRKRTAARR